VSIFGMSEKVGNVSYYDSTGQSDYSFTKPYSEKTAELIDEEVKSLIDSQYERAIDILKKNRGGHEKLAGLLLEREVIFSEDLEEIFGKRPWDKKHVIPENGFIENNKTSKPLAKKESEVTEKPEESKKEDQITEV
jgi:AFG3 family protein